MPVNVTRKGIADQSPTSPERYNAETERIHALAAAAGSALAVREQAREDKDDTLADGARAVIQRAIIGILQITGG